MKKQSQIFTPSGGVAGVEWYGIKIITHLKFNIARENIPSK